jgi:hypothetical protein
MSIKLSSHTENRLNQRLHSIVTKDEVVNKIAQVEKRLTDKRNFVLIKKLPYTEIYDESVKPDGVARGDRIIALVENGVVESVMLRKSTSLNGNPEYRKIISKP